MLDADAIADIEIFRTFSRDELSEIVAKAADLRMLPGEYVVREGDEAYFYVLLSGTANVTKRVGNSELVLATRGRGDFFGETPVLLGSDAFANFLAVTECRLMRLEPLDFQAATVANAELRAIVLASMAARVGEIGNRAVSRKADAIVVVGHRWNVPCRDIRTMLSRNRIRHEYLAVEDPLVAPRLAEFAAYGDDFPLVKLVDGRVLVRPSTRELADVTGLQTKPTSDRYDVIIIGGGPAGLASAVYGASEGLRTLLVEREAPGGQAGTSSRIENYLGFPTGLSGDDLGTRALEQAKRLGAEVLVTREVREIDALGKTITLDGGEVLHASAIILATGVSWRALTIEGIQRLTGMGVYYGAARGEARNTTGKDVFLIGGGNSAGQAAMFFSNYARSVTILIRGADIATSMSDYLVRQLATKQNIFVKTRAEVVGLHGRNHLEAIDVIEHVTETTSTHATDALFVFIGADAETDWLRGTIALDPRGYVLTGADLQGWALDRDPFLLETSVPGVFAVGDLRHGSVKRVASAVGEGSMAIAFTHQLFARTAIPEPSRT